MIETKIALDQRLNYSQEDPEVWREQCLRNELKIEKVMMEAGFAFYSIEAVQRHWETSRRLYVREFEFMGNLALGIVSLSSQDYISTEVVFRTPIAQQSTQRIVFYSSSNDERFGRLIESAFDMGANPEASLKCFNTLHHDLTEKVWDEQVAEMQKEGAE